MFTWTGTPLRTREQVAAIVHQVALNRGLDNLATVIALMTISTEVGTGTEPNRTWWCPANPIVRDSVGFPHDSLSNDNRSMGYFQQQPGPSGEPWWGTTADMMTLESAADSFLARLSPDYRKAAGNPYLAGVYAQKVQGSAFPDRYARAWSEAWTVLRRATTSTPAEGITVPDAPTPDYGITKVMHGFNPNTGPDCTGNSNGPRAQTLYPTVHTQEGDGDAISLANYLNSTWDKGPRAVSYNLTVDATNTVEVVPINEASWSCADANDITFNICFAGSRAAWTRDEWLAQDAMLHRGAQAIAAACQQFAIPVVKVLSTNGWPVTPKGIAGHVDFGRRGGGHHDPGEFVWPEFIDMVNGYLAAPPTNTGGTVPAPSNDDKLDFIYGQLQPYPQLAGKPDALESLRQKIADGMDLTLVDAVAAHIHGLFATESNR